MDRKQFFTNCKFCGKQILMTRNVFTGRFIPCDPEVRFYDSVGNDSYVNPDGVVCFGRRTSSEWGKPGYRKHFDTCDKRYER